MRAAGMLTLRSLALRAVQVTYRHNWRCTEILPQCLQRELLLMWLECEETIPSDDDDLRRIFLRIPSNWCDSRPVCPQTFVDLMSMSDDEIPNFCDEKNHIVFDYYVQCSYDSTRESCLCELCYIRIAKPYLPYSANMWLENGWYFKKIVAHQVIYAEVLLNDVIWKKDNWCTYCVTEPLFDIKDYWNCEMDTTFHTKRRRCSESNDEEELSLQYTEPVVGKRINSMMYKFLSGSR